jgi:formate-dependent nitrite reductase membrane component NrfD
MPDASVRPAWSGETYYRREQVKAAPFNNWLVGGYIFLAGLSGAAALLSTMLDLARPRGAQATTARGRYLSLLAPTAGAAMLIADLHTPQRFYNMLRAFKTTSPMSVGSWLLVSFGAFSGSTAAAHWIAGHVPGFGWLRGVARAAQIPAAAAGSGLATYTASLLSATSNPLWAAAPGPTGVRFGASSVASAAAALSLLEPGRGRTRRNLDRIAVAALALELAASCAADQRYRDAGVDGAMATAPGMLDRTVGTGLGTVMPLGLHLVSLALARRSPALSRVASLAILAGGATMRIAFLAAGDEAALDPSISMRFAQPRNLPSDQD